LKIDIAKKILPATRQGQAVNDANAIELRLLQKIRKRVYLQNIEYGFGEEALQESTVFH
jgi:hypothetical protein